MATSKPKRRWLRYSLRSLLLVTLALSIWLGWMANRAVKQRQAVDLVEALGGKVLYDCQAHVSRPAGPAGQQFVMIDLNRDPSTDLLHRCFEHDWIDNVSWIVFANANVSDRQLQLILDGLPNVTGISLRGCPITDRTLERLASMTNLKSANLRDTRVSYDGVSELRRRRPDMNVADNL